MKLDDKKMAVFFGIDNSTIMFGKVTILSTKPGLFLICLIFSIVEIVGCNMLIQSDVI